jgi:hypothetical protein
VSRLTAYAYNLFVTTSQLTNALTGGDPDESISGRIGKSIRRDGLGARIPWPSFAKRHFLRSIEDDEGGNRAGKRTETF